MRQQVCNKNDYAIHGLDHTVDLFWSSAKENVVIFTNSKKKSFALVDSLENKIDQAKLAVPVGVLHIHGSLLNTGKKNAHLVFFFRPPNENELNANIFGLVGTHTVNVGIGDNLIELVIWFEFPCDLPMVFQKQGCGSC